MIVAIIVLASVLAVSVAGHVMQGVWLRTARADAAANLELANKYKDERNEQAVRAAVNAKLVGEHEAKIRVLSALLKDADKRNADRTVKEIAGAPTNAAAADAFGSVFRVPIIGDVPKAGDADTSDDRPGPSTVRPT